jgi:hypothetical protein
MATFFETLSSIIETYGTDVIIHELPLSYESNFNYDINILDSSYHFEFKWNTDLEFWTLEIYDKDNTLICTTKIVNSWNIVNNFKHKSTLTSQILILLPLAESTSEPNQYSLNEDFVLQVSNLNILWESE